MADQEHLDVLKQGAPVWNTWREAHPIIRPDLRDADLSGVDLREATLVEANLTNADLTGCRAIRRYGMGRLSGQFS